MANILVLLQDAAVFPKLVYLFRRNYLFDATCFLCYGWLFNICLSGGLV